MEPVAGPNDSFSPSPGFMDAIREVSQIPVPVPKAPPIHFSTSPEALEHNAQLLKNHKYSMESLISRNDETTLAYGSEFRPINQLQSILGGHTHFQQLLTILQEGMAFRFSRNLTEAERTTKLHQIVARGNHKSAEDKPDAVAQLLAKNVTHGFSMPIPLHVVKQIPGALAQPLGMAKQITLNNAGQWISEYRLTQDLSFSISQKNCLVNDRIDMDQYNEMIYGWFLSRIGHYVVALRSQFPTDRVLMSKYDYSNAYRRIAHSASASTQSISVFKDIAYVALQLNFGGSPNPPTWCLFSEMVTGLANELYMCPDWNLDQVRSPGQPIRPTPKLDSGDEPFSQALPTTITVPTSLTAKTDGFIDDLTTVFRDTPQNRERAPHTVPLAMHVTSRPHAGPDEPVTRQNILADHKLVAEGPPAETQIILGWVLKTRRLLIALPKDKLGRRKCGKW
jgi:hypothetical protein